MKMLNMFAVLFLLMLTNIAHGETIPVPSDGTTVYSSALDAGQSYKITAEGTYVGWQYMGMNLLADAEWRELEDHTWIENPTDENLHDILINDTEYDWMGRDPDIPGAEFAPHTYSPDHIYVLYLLGSDQPISLQIYDSYYGDNSGSLTVNIDPVVPIPGAVWLFCSGLLGVLGYRKKVNKT